MPDFAIPWISTLASATASGDSMPFWSYLQDILILLALAMVLGGLFERFKQSAIVGYLLAGTLLGPHALNAINNDAGVSTLAELGVALLLFTIGLEFSWQRLRRLGATVFVIGALQVVLTIIAVTGLGIAVGLSVSAATAVGAILSLSSTAVVLRVLSDRAEVDSIHGRSALGILLVQDIAVVPLVLLIEALGGKGTAIQAIWGVGQEVAMAAGMILFFVVISHYVMPRIVKHPTISKNRELPILFAIVVALGSAWAASVLGLSPALGAFVAGVIIGGSPLATQIRSDVGPLKTLFVTLFFSTIGMLADLEWIVHHLALVIGVIAGVIVVKTVVIWLILRIFRYAHRFSIAAGLSLSQVGEFSFVLAGVAWAGGRQAGVISDDVFTLIISVTIGTLFVTPYLVVYAVPIGSWIERKCRKAGLIRKPEIKQSSSGQAGPQDHVVIIGFGPAGQAVAEVVGEKGKSATLPMDESQEQSDENKPPSLPVTVIDLNPRTVLAARGRGIWAMVGDASSPDIIEHANIKTAKAVVVTLPYYRAAALAIRQIRAACPGVPIIARARYHIHTEILQDAGAQVVVDEEANVGQRMGAQVQEVM